MSRLMFFSAVLVSCFAILTGPAVYAGSWTVVPTPDNSFNFWILKDGQAVFSNGMAGWGPNWSPFMGGPRSTACSSNGTLSLSSPWGHGIKAGLRAGQIGDHRLTFRYELTAAAEKPLLMLMTGLSVAKEFQAGQLVLTLKEGKPRALPIPWSRGELGPELVEQITFKLKDAGDVVVGVEPACRVHLENNNLRIAFAADKIAKGTTAVTLTFDFPDKAALLADKDSIHRYIQSPVGPGWYPSLYSAEGPAIYAAYGMGLQGWDASYEFQSASSRVNYAGEVGWFLWGVWEGDLPTQLGQTPTLARMIYRGDVQEGEIISTRVVSPQSLQTGTFDFSDEISQLGDIKTFAAPARPRPWPPAGAWSPFRTSPPRAASPT